MALDGGVDLGGAQRAVETEEISDETRNMWGGHRSSGKGLNRSIVVSRNDVEARGPDINARTKVRERSLGVGDGGGSNGNGLFDTSGRVVDNILVVVSRSDDNGDAGVKELEDERGITTDERLDIS